MTLAATSRPKLWKFARVQFDDARQKNVLQYPEGAVLLNDTAAEILSLCDGVRSRRPRGIDKAWKYQTLNAPQSGNQTNIARDALFNSNQGKRKSGCPILLPRFQHRQKRLLRNIDAADRFHPLLAFASAWPTVCACG